MLKRFFRLPIELLQPFEDLNSVSSAPPPSPSRISPSCARAPPAIWIGWVFSLVPFSVSYGKIIDPRYRRTLVWLTDRVDHSRGEPLMFERIPKGRSWGAMTRENVSANIGRLNGGKRQRTWTLVRMKKCATHMEKKTNWLLIHRLVITRSFLLIPIFWENDSYRWKRPGWDLDL